MPFHCDIQFEPTHVGAPLSEPAYVERWLVNPSEFIEPGTAVALLSIAGASSELRLRFRCQIAELSADPGALLKLGAPLLRVYAEGEHIPPGFQYCSTHTP